MNSISDFKGTFRTYPSARNPYTIIDYLSQGFLEAEKVDVMVGYFELSFFHVLSSIAPFLYNSGKVVRVFCGHQLSKEVASLVFEKSSIGPSGVEVERAIERIWKRQLDDVAFGSYDSDVLLLVEHLISQEQLSIVPIVISDSGGRGIFHQKEYVFHGESWKSRGLGSANMTASGLIHNRESMIVSWESADNLSEDMLDSLDMIEAISSGSALDYCFAAKSDVVLRSIKDWRRANPDSVVLDEVHKRALDRVLKFASGSNTDVLSGDVKQGFGSNFGQVKLWDHQILAIEKWCANDHVGLFEMCTGAGKTITALAAVVQLWNRLGEPCPVVISVPSVPLCDQWHDQFKAFFPKARVHATTGKHKDSDWLDLARVRFRGDRDYADGRVPVIVGRHQNLLGFMEEIGAPGFKRYLLIADECHTIGERSVRRGLENLTVSYRLGLSATPDRYMDAEGTEFVRSFFDAVPKSLMVFSISDAINGKCLVPYQYSPVFFELEEERQKEYTDLSIEIKRFGFVEEREVPEALKHLLLRRVRLILKSPAKKAAFNEWLNDQIMVNGLDSLKKMIVFAPEGFEEQSDLRILEGYMTLMREKGLRVRSFLGGSNTGSQRNYMSAIDAFKEGSIDVLVAMKCLDEGVDIPVASTGLFLSSTGNPRQYIQRRGRLLRTHPSKDRARIFDFICTPAIRRVSLDRDVQEAERSILRRELMRSWRFIDDAENTVDGFEAWRTLLTESGNEVVFRDVIEENHE